ncbi:hypothetical protein D3C85_1394010 [compost metagenome]
MLPGIDDSAHGGGGIGRVTRHVMRASCAYLFQHLFVDVLMHECTAGRAAGLATPGQVHSVDDRGCDQRGIYVGICDQGVLAAQFQCNGLQAFGRAPHDGAACGGAAHQPHHGDVRMGHQRGAQFRATGKYRHDAGRQHAAHDFRQAQRRQRRLLRRFDDDAVARCERRRHFSRSE